VQRHGVTLEFLSSARNSKNVAKRGSLEIEVESSRTRGGRGAKTHFSAGRRQVRQGMTFYKTGKRMRENWGRRSYLLSPKNASMYARPSTVNRLGGKIVDMRGKENRERSKDVGGTLGILKGGNPYAGRARASQRKRGKNIPAGEGIRERGTRGSTI